MGVKKTEIKKIISIKDKFDFNVNIGKNAIKQKILVFFKCINYSSSIKGVFLQKKFIKSYLSFSFFGLFFLKKFLTLFQ